MKQTNRISPSRAWNKWLGIINNVFISTVNAVVTLSGQIQSLRHQGNWNRPPTPPHSGLKLKPTTDVILHYVASTV